jgi:hypothetical protein
MGMGGPSVGTLAGPRGNFVEPGTAFADPGMRGNGVVGNWRHGRVDRDFRHGRFGAFAGLYGLGLGYDLGRGYDLPYDNDYNSCYVLTPYRYQWVGATLCRSIAETG